MTETSAKVIADSISPNGQRLTTLQVVMHRFVLAEFNTHRKFSRNSASSRARPVEKMLERFHEDTAWPLSYPAEQPGMQGGAELADLALTDAEILLGSIREYTNRKITEYLEDHPDKSTRLHKSIINRLMEWGQWHTVVVSSTEWDNFFAQRCSPLAQPEIRAAAEAMREALDTSIPWPLQQGEFHTPYIQPDELSTMTARERIMVSVARCARVSYLTQEGVRDMQEDINLYERLVSADPPHWSPLEHVAAPVGGMGHLIPGNFDGWKQLRHMPAYAEVLIKDYRNGIK